MVSSMDHNIQIINGKLQLRVLESRIVSIITYKSPTRNYSGNVLFCEKRKIIAYKPSTGNHSGCSIVCPWNPIITYKPSTGNYSRHKVKLWSAMIITYKSSTENFSALYICYALFIVMLILCSYISAFQQNQLSCNNLYIIIESEDSDIDQLSRQRNNELCRDAARCGVYIGLCDNLKPNRFSIELKENALRALHILQGP